MREMDREGYAGKLLIVDDDPMALEVLDVLLSEAGYAITRASDGLEAWALLQDERTHFDALILDRVMPHLDGLALLGRVRNLPRLHNLPVVLQTSASTAADIEEGLRAGVFYYLVKPYDPQLLSVVVQAAISDGRDRQALVAGLAGRARAVGLMYAGRFQCRKPAEARDLAMLLASACDNPDAVVVGLSELLMNGIEHGNLGVTHAVKGELLKQGRWKEEIARRMELPEFRHRRLDVRVDRGDGVLIITISDEGEGFDPAMFLDFDPLRATHAHGRGIAMARLMSFQSLQYLGRGNQVMVTALARSGGNAYAAPRPADQPPQPVAAVRVAPQDAIAQALLDS